MGPEDAVVIKLNAKGEVLWSTYLGGTERRFCSGAFCDPPPDSATAIAVDAGGNVYVAGITTSIDFPLVNPFNTSNTSSSTASDGFIAKISADGQRLLYSSILGIGAASGLAVGPAGEAWIASSTSLIKLNPAGSPIWSRRHGVGPFYGSLRVDGMGRAYIAGQQCDRDVTGLPVCRTTVEQLDPSGAALLYEAIFQDSPRILIGAHPLAVTPDGRAVVTGLGCQTTLPARRAPNVGAPDCSVGEHDGWMVTLNPSGEVEAVTYADTGAHSAVTSDAEGRVIVLSTRAPAGLLTARALVDHHVDGPLYMSADRGATWRASAAPVATLSQVFDLDYDGARKSVYAAIDDVAGLYESFDAGRSWQRDRRPRNAVLPPNVFVPAPSAITGLAIDRRDPSIRYATAGGSILRHDAMSDWQVALPGQSNTVTEWFPVETNPIDGTVWTATRGSLAISADSGRTWVRRPLRTPEGAALLPSSIVFHPTRLGTVYLGANDLWASYDTGESWLSLTAAIEPRPAITAIAIDSTSNILHAGSASRIGVLRSVDGGQSWTATLVGHRITAVAVDPSRPNLVYAGGTDPDNRPAVYRSIDRGETWERTMNGLDTRSDVTQLLLDPRDPSRIYVGSRLGEVPFVARFVSVGPVPGRVRVPGAASTALSRSDFATYLGHGIARAVTSTPTGAIVIALEIRPVNQPSRVAGVAAVVIDETIRWPR